MGGFASSKILEVHGERMVKRTFDPGFRIALHQKDLNLALTAARQLGLALPATGTAQQREMVQDALNRWWTPIMHFHGPPDKVSQHTEVLMRWKVKMATNDDMRYRFLDEYVPKIWDLGLTIPDPKLRKNEETGVWEYTEPDWDEFKRVINGDGPCNKERLQVRRWAEEKGAWVRRALLKTESKYTIPLA